MTTHTTEDQETASTKTPGWETVLGALTRDWRGTLVAAIGSLAGLLVVQIGGSSPPVLVAGGLAGAIVSTLIRNLAKDLEWRDRRLTAIAGVLVLLNLRVPQWLATRVAAASSRIDLPARMPVSLREMAFNVGGGATLGLIVGFALGPAPEPPSLSGSWRIADFAAMRATGDYPDTAPESHRLEIAACSNDDCAYRVTMTGARWSDDSFALRRGADDRYHGTWTAIWQCVDEQTGAVLAAEGSSVKLTAVITPDAASDGRATRLGIELTEAGTVTDAGRDQGCDDGTARWRGTARRG